MERLTECVGYQNGRPIYKTKIDMRKLGSVDKLKEALGRYEDREEEWIKLGFTPPSTIVSEEHGGLFRTPISIEQFLKEVYNLEIGQSVYEVYQFLGEGAWEIEEHTLKLEDFSLLGKTVFTSMDDAKQEVSRREVETSIER